MQIKVGDIRKIIREEYLRGVPTFALRSATEKYVADIKQHMMRFILSNKSLNSIDQRAAIAAANEVLEQFEEKANDLLEDQLYQFIRGV